MIRRENNNNLVSQGYCIQHNYADLKRGAFGETLVPFDAFSLPEYYIFNFLKLEAKVQELQSRLDAELDARDKISQTSHSVQSKITQLEKQIWDLTDQLKKESDAHGKVKKSHSDLQKVCVILMQ